jgi:hypothetical protein
MGNSVFKAQYFERPIENNAWDFGIRMRQVFSGKEEMMRIDKKA